MLDRLAITLLITALLAYAALSALAWVMPYIGTLTVALSNIP